MAILTTQSKSYSTDPETMGLGIMSMAAIRRLGVEFYTNCLRQLPPPRQPLTFGGDCSKDDGDDRGGDVDDDDYDDDDDEEEEEEECCHM